MHRHLRHALPRLRRRQDVIQPAVQQDVEVLLGAGCSTTWEARARGKAAGQEVLVAAAACRWQSAGLTDPAADLLLDSGSGVDPHISLAAARQQLPRLARERQLPLAELERLIPQHQEGPLGLQAIGPVVNVLRFNLALDQLASTSTTQSPPVPARR
jgi:K+-transporting ATPase ATPase C chain